jgi:predicted DNA-binding transcriptional regulator AlpA
LPTAPDASGWRLVGGGDCVRTFVDVACYRICSRVTDDLPHASRSQATGSRVDVAAWMSCSSGIGTAAMARKQRGDRRLPTLKEIRELWPATVDVPRAGLAFGFSRSHSYSLVSCGKFPAKVIQVGCRYRVVTESIIDVLSSRAA